MCVCVCEREGQFKGVCACVLGEEYIGLDVDLDVDIQRDTPGDLC